eukprot:3049767-Amphidinium_carterae.1
MVYAGMVTRRSNSAASGVACLLGLALDADGNGQLDPSEILGVAELTENPLVQRVISVFDKDGFELRRPVTTLSWSWKAKLLLVSSCLVSVPNALLVCGHLGR